MISSNQKLKMLFLPGSKSALLEMNNFIDNINRLTTIKYKFLLNNELEQYSFDKNIDIKNKTINIDEEKIRKKWFDYVYVKNGNFIRRSLQKITKPFLITYIWFRIFEFINSRVKDVLMLEQPSCIVLRGDRHIGYETSFIKIAKSLKIPTIIIPHAISDPDCTALERYRSNYFLSDYSTNKIFNKMILIFFPKWFYNFNGKYILHMQSEKCLAAKIHGIMPKNIWSLGGGQSDIIACEGSFMYEQMMKQGVSSQKLVITGKASNDKVCRSYGNKKIKKSIRTTYNLKETDFVVLLAMPNHFEHKYLKKYDHFLLLEDIAKIICQKNNIKIIVSLHPKSSKNDYEDFAKKHSMIIASHPYNELLTVADIYIATLSSTIMLSCSLKVPTIVENFMVPVNDKLYKNIPYLHIANSIQEFRSQYLELIHKDKNTKEFIDKSKLPTIVDGKSTLRIKSLIENMIKINSC